MAEGLRWLPVSGCVRTLRRGLLVLMTALVLMQTVGVLHRVAHAHNPQSMSVGENFAPPHSILNTFQALWGEHSSTVDCQLFDQSCPDALNATAELPMPVLNPPCATAAAFLERFALFERFYAARGPPLTLI